MGRPKMVRLHLPKGITSVADQEEALEAAKDGTVEVVEGSQTYWHLLGLGAAEVGTALPAAIAGKDEGRK